MATPYLTLGDLVTAQGLPAFLESFATKTCWHLIAGRADTAPILLPWLVINGLVTNGVFPLNCFRVVVNGNELPTALYTDARARLRPDAVQRFAAQGATLAITDIGALVPAIDELATTVERDLRCKVNVNCYLTFGSASAFPPHYDDHDVLCLQIDGTKRWRTFGASMPFPLASGRPGGNPAHSWEGMTTPGDLLYLPRGVIHAAVPERRPSVHLTFGLFEDTGIDFLRWLASKAHGVDELRRELGASASGRGRTLRDDGCTAAVRALLDGATLGEFFDAQDRDRPLQPFASLQLAHGGTELFRPDAQLVSALRRHLDLDLGLTGELSVHMGKQHIRLSNLARRALAQITQHHRITVAQLTAALDCASDDEMAMCLQDLAGKCLISIAA